MEWWAFVSEAFLASAESSEILSSFGYNITVEVEYDSASRFASDIDVEIYFRHDDDDDDDEYLLFY